MVFVKKRFKFKAPVRPEPNPTHSFDAAHRAALQQFSCHRDLLGQRHTGCSIICTSLSAAIRPSILVFCCQVTSWGFITRER